MHYSGKPLPARAFHVFHRRSAGIPTKELALVPYQSVCASINLRIFHDRASAAGAPNARHVPVNELHSIENKRDEVGHLCLTLIRGGVKSHSFFDNSDVFPVGAESGAQAVVTAQQSALDESREADGNGR